MTESLALCLHITRRNFAVYRKNLISNIAPTVSDPAFYILSLGLGLGAYVAGVKGRSYLEFIAPGMAVTTALFGSFFEAAYGFYVRLTYESVFKAMLTTPIGPREIILGEFIWICLKGGLMTLVTSLVLLAFGLVKDPWLIVLMLPIGALVSLACGAFGLVASSFVENIDQFQTVYAFFISPMFFFSGIFFPIESMPLAAQWLAWMLPLAHGVRLAQAVFWNENIVSTEFAARILLLSAQSLLLCVWTYRRIKGQLQT